MKKRIKFQLKFICVLLCTTMYCTKSYADGYSTGYGKWYQYYYKDDFDDEIYDKPYIKTSIKSRNSGKVFPTYLGIQIPVLVNDNLAFLLYISESGYTVNFVPNQTTLKIKSANGTISTIPVVVDDERDCFYIIGDDNVRRFANLIDSGNYSIVVYSSQKSWAFYCYDETKNFWQAAQKVFK